MSESPSNLSQCLSAQDMAGDLPMAMHDTGSVLLQFDYMEWENLTHERVARQRAARKQSSYKS